MKSKFLAIYILFVVSINYKLYSIDYISEFSDLKEGTILESISEEYFDLKLYIFMDVNSCFVCQDMIPELDKYLTNNDLKVEKVIFFGGASKNMALDYKKTTTGIMKLLEI